MTRIKNLIAAAASLPVPDYIWESLSEIAGTLIASILIAVITAYVFNRRQEIQKVRARILHFRLEQYEQIIRCLGQYSDRHSWEGNIRNQILDALEEAELPLSNDELVSPSVLTSEDETLNMLKELESFSTKGLYILDDDVQGALLKLKVYMMNYHMFADLIECYLQSHPEKFPGEVCEHVKEIFFQYYSLVVAEEYDGVVASLEEMIQRKRSSVRFERSGKNYRNVRRRKKLRNSLLDSSVLCGNMVNALHLIGLILATEMGWGDEEAASGIKDWMSYVLDIVSFRLK